MKSELVTIGLVDDFPALRKGLTYLFKEEENFEVILEAGNGKELQKVLKKDSAPEILILDMRMPEMNGMETLQWLHDNHEEKIKPIIYTDCKTDLTVIKLYILGARAILQKTITPKELLKAIRRVKEDGYYYNDSFSRNLLVQLRSKNEKGGKKLKPVLTAKEEKFLKLLTEDKSYKEMADIFGSTEGAMNKMRHILFEKLEVRSKEALAIKAKDNCID